MSRLDDFEYPPGLGFVRANADRDLTYHHSPSASLAGFGPPDRRMSFANLGGASYAQQSVPRSATVQDYDFGIGGANDAPWSPVSPNTGRQTFSNVPTSHVQHFPPFNHNHHHRPSPPPPASSSAGSGNTVYVATNNGLSSGANLGNSSLYSPTGYSERDVFLPRQPQPPSSQLIVRSQHAHTNSSSNSDSYITRSTLCWGGLEPWMDDEYVKQVCGLMGWNPTDVRVPHPSPDPVSGQQTNNPGYCFLTFSSPGQAASVIAQMNNNGNGPMAMPNSSKPFALNWASNVPSVSVTPSYPSTSPVTPNGQRYEKEYSIFVGDLPPEASNSDLVAVFRNPVLGLRNDREPKFVRPFLSCKSAKIMLDPVTGVSRGYGFVRFTDESDQQRALVEMHGLYCLSRPMRISPATAKFKAPPGQPGAPVQYAPSSPTAKQPVTIALPLPATNQTKSVSAPIAATPNSSESTPSVTHASVHASTSHCGSSINGSLSTPSLSSSVSTSMSSLASAPSDDMLKMFAQYQNGSTPVIEKSTSTSLNSITAPFATEPQDTTEGSNFNLSEESWKHHAQARAILSNLIGPNGEQLTSSDPYNTTVFVGGLSPLISEETLRTFFAPFGDIHYVKVPVGKHCGFVQFVHKKDAERAIEKMQGFPIGGSRIRLSWGRSQYKAAQAAAQAAQAAALQAQVQSQAPQPSSAGLTAEQAIQLLQKFGLTAFLNNPSALAAAVSENNIPNGFPNGSATGGQTNEDNSRSTMSSRDSDRGASASFDGFSNTFGSRNNVNLAPARSTFSPFSPDPNLFLEERRNRESMNPARSELLPHPSKSYAPGFGLTPLQTQDMNGSNLNGVNKSISPITPTSAHGSRPSNHRFNSFLASSGRQFDISRTASRASFHGPEPSKEFEGHEQDLIQDLNGTLASLDLDNNQGAWRVSDDRTESNSPGQSSRQ